MRTLDKPAAVARVRWLSADEGGRASGPPAAPLYSSTCAFPLDGVEPTPEWLANTDLFSILLQRIGPVPAMEEQAQVGFLVPDLVAPHLHDGARLVVTEGHRVVAYATIEKTL